jgi:hypothetical protein
MCEREKSIQNDRESKDSPPKKTLESSVRDFISFLKFRSHPTFFLKKKKKNRKEK